MKWSKEYGEKLKEGLSSGMTLRESCELALLPYDKVLFWLDPMHEDYSEECESQVEHGRRLSKVKNQSLVAKVDKLMTSALYSPVILPLLEQITISVAAKGGSDNMIAARLGISGGTLKEWCKNYPEVKEVVEIGRTKAIAWLEEQALDHIIEKPFCDKVNVQLFKHMAAVVDPETHNISSKNESVIKGDKDNPVVLEGIVFEVVKSTKRMPKTIEGEVIHGTENQKESEE